MTGVLTPPSASDETLADLTALDAAWQVIEAWYAARGAEHLLRPGADESDLEQLEERLGARLPDQWRASIMRHDGSLDEGWPTGTLLSCNGILAETTIWRDLLRAGTFRDAHPQASANSALRPLWWHHQWICLDADGGGNGAMVDLAPGPDGVVGQVLDMDHETGPTGPVSDSVAGYLVDIALRLNGLIVEDDALVDRSFGSGELDDDDDDDGDAEEGVEAEDDFDPDDWRTFWDGDGDELWEDLPELPEDALETINTEVEEDPEFLDAIRRVGPEGRVVIFIQTGRVARVWYARAGDEMQLVSERAFDTVRAGVAAMMQAVYSLGPAWETDERLDELVAQADAIEDDPEQRAQLLEPGRDLLYRPFRADPMSEHWLQRLTLAHQEAGNLSRAEQLARLGVDELPDERASWVAWVGELLILQGRIDEGVGAARWALGHNRPQALETFDPEIAALLVQRGLIAADEASTDR